MDLEHQPTPLAGTALVARELLPDVPLIDAQTGKEWRPSQLRQRSALVLCFMHAGCQECHRLLVRLAGWEEDIRWADAQVRVVLPEVAAAPFPVLLDRQEHARTRMLGPDGQIPTVLVANRYTAVAESYPAPEHDFPDPERIVAMLRFLVCDCS